MYLLGIIRNFIKDILSVSLIFLKIRRNFDCLAMNKIITIYCDPIVAQKKNSLFFVSIKMSSSFLRRGFLKLTSIEAHLRKICQSYSIKEETNGLIESAIELSSWRWTDKLVKNSCSILKIQSTKDTKSLVFTAVLRVREFIFAILLCLVIQFKAA